MARKRVSAKSRSIEKNLEKKFSSCKLPKNACNCGGGGYCLGVLGAAIYYITTATSFWVGVLGILKALVWPAFLVFEVLKFLGA